MTNILGIAAFYHDSSAALVVDGKIVAAAQEERFSRKKFDADFPQQSVEFCLREANLSADQLDYVVFYEKPLRKFERLLETYLAYCPKGYRSFRRAIPLWVKQRLNIPSAIRNGLKGKYSGKLVYVDHHESHAASAFFPSPFDQAAILTMDGVGEWSTTCLSVGKANRIEPLLEMRFPHSLGLLYSAFTYYTGFRVNSGEYKLMGLAPYGTPVYRDLILKHLMDLKEDGSFRMDMQYFNYCQGLTMTSGKFHRLFGGEPRKPESPITQRDMDLAASIQAVTEEVILRTARFVKTTTGLKNLVLAGGVALNCVANGKLLREELFDGLWIQPAAGDAGGSLGAAMFVWHQLLDRPRVVESGDSQRGSLLGPKYSQEQIQQELDQLGAVYTTCEDDDQLCELTAGHIDNQLVVGWFQGGMEFGPRALGNRSILGDPRSPQMQSVMNLKIKFRESFRPFAPIVLAEQAHQYFDLPVDQESPYMLLVAEVGQSIRIDPLVADPARVQTGQSRGSLRDPTLVRGANHDDSLQGFEKLKQIRSSLPAITHVDRSARIQTVDRHRNPLLHKLLTAFHRRTGCPAMINTSFNIRSEPVVCTPQDAFRCFMMTNIDVLIVGRHILLKTDQQHSVTENEVEAHLAQFEPD
jgi:carbamoyltransferase